MKPPYDITLRILDLVAAVSEKLGEIKSAYLMKPPAELRRLNRIRTIQSSLEIEGNTLSLDQITALLDDKKVLAPAKDILEVKNAIEVYDRLDEFKPYSLESLCSAHKPLTGTCEVSIVRAFLMSVLDYIHQYSARLRVERLHSEVVEDQQIASLDALKVVYDSALSLGDLQQTHQPGGVRVHDTEALLAGFITDRCGQIAFAYTVGP